MRQRNWFGTMALAVWLGWCTVSAFIGAYPLASGRKPIDWPSVVIVAAFIVAGLFVAFLIGRSVEREAMREKLRVIIRSGRLPVVDPPVITNPNLIRINEPMSEEQEADFRAQFKAAQADAHRMTVGEFSTTMADAVAQVRTAQVTCPCGRLQGRKHNAGCSSTIQTGPGEYDKHFPRPGA